MRFFIHCSNIASHNAVAETLNNFLILIQIEIKSDVNESCRVLSFFSNKSRLNWSPSLKHITVSLNIARESCCCVATLASS